MKSRGMLTAIGVFKLAKAAVLVAAGVGLLQLSGRDAPSVLAHGTRALGLDPASGALAPLFTKVSTASNHALTGAAIGALVYAALFLAEGIGLLRGKRWGEYLTIAITASFMPFEIYELVTHASVTKVLALVLNAAIVAYLVIRVRADARARQADIHARRTRPMRAVSGAFVRQPT